MAEMTIQQKAASKIDQWRERISEQERSGFSVRRFCQQQGIAEHALYYWRKRLRERQQPMRFALIERGSAPQGHSSEMALELVLTSGERLRIGAGVDEITLRTVLSVLRA